MMCIQIEQLMRGDNYMFYVTETKNNLCQVIDTKDGVVEGYSFQDLKSFLKAGIEIHGMTEDFAIPCKREDNLLFVPDIVSNKLSIYSIKDNRLVDSFNFRNAECDRNEASLLSSIRTKLSKDKKSILIRCQVCVKFDYEFTGLFYLKVGRDSGYIQETSGSVLFIEDDNGEVDEIRESTCGDCPDFISSEEAVDILRKKGIV